MTAEIHSRSQIYRGRVFTLVQESVTLANGADAQLDVIDHPGAAAIVPLIEKSEVLMLRQYRHAVRTTLWEIPAGTLDPEETLLDCAGRELIEETGYRANRWHKLGEIVPVPGYSSERIHIWLARDLVPASQNLDQDEVIEVERVAFGEALAMIRRGEIQDAKSICGLYLAEQYLRG